jgi:Fe-S cluster assembly protein SufD
MLQLTAKPRDIRAWERFLQIGLPTKEWEEYRYVKLKELYSHPFHSPQPNPLSSQSASETLLFLDGAYCPSLSHPPKPCIALPLSEAFKVYGSFLHPRLQRGLKEEKDPFAALNAAYFAEGLFLYIPPNTVCKTPINILHRISQMGEPTLLCPRIHLFVGKGAAATLLFSQKQSSEHVWSNAVIDLALEEGAALSLAILSKQGERAHDFLALRATLKSQSLFKSYEVTNGGGCSRHDYAIQLLGERANASLYGICDVKGKRQHHVNVLMDHQEPCCTSLQKFKGVVRDHALTSFEGKIYVHQKAQKTEAYQMNNNLLLSQGASAYSKPNLEIFADDVKASHGATVGQVDEEQLFYLTARALPLELARTLLIRGFFQEIIDLMEEPQAKKEALEVIA